MARYREQTAPSDGAPDDGERALSPAARRLLGIVAYYAVLGAAGVLLWRTSADFRALVESDRLRELTGGELASPGGARGIDPGAAVEYASRPGIRTLLALLGALAIALPVAWVYSLTRRKRGFEQSMVHTLILLPVAVAGMAVLIQNSLALAFGLTGIVALLRFRNTLDDTKDGVYVFVATTIGISAAVGVLVVGVATSVVFNAVALVLWWADFARTPTPGIRGGLRRLARLPSPGSMRHNGAAHAAREGESPEDALARAARARQRALTLTSEHRAIDPAGRFNTTLRVHTSDLGASQSVVERILGEQTKRYQLVGITPAHDGHVMLKYLVRVRGSARGELLNALRGHHSAHVVGVEFK